MLLQIIVTAIEPGSPAAENEDIVVGLALASVNGAALPDGGVQMLKKAWRALLVSRQQIALECVAEDRNFFSMQQELI